MPKEHLQGISKFHSLNYYLEGHLHKKTLSISFQHPTTFLYLVCTLESNSRSLSLAREKPKIEDGYI
jgi:hypothetical protein